MRIITRQGVIRLLVEGGMEGGGMGSGLELSGLGRHPEHS